MDLSREDALRHAQGQPDFALETSLKYILNCQLCLSMKFLSTVCETFDVAACFSSLPLAKNALHSPSSIQVLKILI